MSYNKGDRCLYSLTIHVVLVTKYRKKIIDKAILQRLQEIVAHTREQWSSTLTDFNGESHHVHLVAISKLVHNLKTVSSWLIPKEYADGINQIIVSQCCGLEAIALPVVAALLGIRSNNRLKINVKLQTNGSPTPSVLRSTIVNLLRGGTPPSPPTEQSGGSTPQFRWGDYMYW